MAEKMQGSGAELTYWKAHQTMLDVYSSELAYSLIYNNILPDKMEEALGTVGLHSLPNRFFLIQVDDYLRRSRTMPITQEYHQKTTLIHSLRKILQPLPWEGFAANLIGEEKLICFLVCEEGKGVLGRLRDLAGRFQQVIRENSSYTLSVCISGYCGEPGDFSRMFPRMNRALSENSFWGKESIVLLEKAGGKSGAEEEKHFSLKKMYPEIMAAVVQKDEIQLDEIIERIKKQLQEKHISPGTAYLAILCLIQWMERYCMRCGVPEESLLELYQTAAMQIPVTRFVGDTCGCLRDYCRGLIPALQSIGGKNSEKDPLTLLIEEFVAENYTHTLRLRDVADAMGFSEGHFARIFRKRFGVTFVEYLTAYRVERSRELLTQTQMSVEQIAYRVGFNSCSYFCTCFRQACGLSPGGYRNQRLADSLPE